ncbi:DUF3499 domain-containing protein [Arsenicicoccus bolidensis]|uniref:DUF3499 domain-containing protein n=1 Tax=Arsenicicoccus bolidensis TaxID=229480 RepID=A0ABS9Q224_9MICO|nr:DUF3499 domain-containing protein [Arsenicicoccus bolidensis]MCG7321919.1 DUF3499 domain-containing protein [Arsenicicoccus bolidensis]
MTVQRLCSKTPCGRPAVATLTYVYADSQIVLGALATFAEPHSYDLCADHARRLTAPRGWEVVRLVPEFAEPEPAPDELVAIADAVRGPRRRPSSQPQPQSQAQSQSQSRDGGAGAERRTVVATPRTSEQAREVSARVARQSGTVSAVEVGRRGHLRVLRDLDLDADAPDAPADPAARDLSAASDAPAAPVAPVAPDDTVASDEPGGTTPARSS